MKNIDWSKVLETLCLIVIVIAFIVAIVFYHLPEKQTTNCYVTTQTGINLQ